MILKIFLFLVVKTLVVVLLFVAAILEKMHMGKPVEGIPIQLLREALINSRQHEAFLRVILVSTDLFVFRLLTSA